MLSREFLEDCFATLKRIELMKLVGIKRFERAESKFCKASSGSSKVKTQKEKTLTSRKLTIAGYVSNPVGLSRSTFGIK